VFVGGVCFVAVCLLVFAVHDLCVAILLSTHDILLYGTMTATIVMMSAALGQKKNCVDRCSFRWKFANCYSANMKLLAPCGLWNLDRSEKFF